MGNGIHMPLAEWLYRMAQQDVPYQARSLAIYAVLFKITANDELAVLSGMDTKGIADKTYNKWKKLLADNGWLILKSSLVGRTTVIEIYPALATHPVTFTDVKARDPKKFADKTEVGTVEVTAEVEGAVVKVTSESYVSSVKDTRNNDEPPVKVTRQNYGLAVEVTSEFCATVEIARESYGAGVEITGGASRVLDNNNNNLLVDIPVSEVSNITPLAPVAENQLDVPSPSSGGFIDEAFNAYNALAQSVGLPIARTLTPQRRKNLAARLREHGVDSWSVALANIRRSAFLQGRNDRGWRCHFDFLLQPSSYTKVVEGTYGNGAHAECFQKESRSEARMRMLQDDHGRDDVLDLEAVREQ